MLFFSIHSTPHSRNGKNHKKRAERRRRRRTVEFERGKMINCRRDKKVRNRTGKKLQLFSVRERRGNINASNLSDWQIREAITKIWCFSGALKSGSFVRITLRYPKWVRFLRAQKVFPRNRVSDAKGVILLLEVNERLFRLIAMLLLINFVELSYDRQLGIVLWNGFLM